MNILRLDQWFEEMRNPSNEIFITCKLDEKPAQIVKQYQGDHPNFQGILGVWREYIAKIGRGGWKGSKLTASQMYYYLEPGSKPLRAYRKFVNFPTKHLSDSLRSALLTIRYIREEERYGEQVIHFEAFVPQTQKNLLSFYAPQFRILGISSFHKLSKQQEEPLVIQLNQIIQNIHDTLDYEVK